MNRFQEMFERAAATLEYWQGLAAMEFAGGVREMLARREMKQRELADALGKKESYLSRVLNQGENLTIKQMQTILEPLGAAAHILVIDRRNVLDWRERPRDETPAPVAAVQPKKVYGFIAHQDLVSESSVPRNWVVVSHTPS